MNTAPLSREISRFRMLRGLQRRIPDPARLMRLDHTSVASPPMTWVPHEPALKVDVQHLLMRTLAPSPSSASTSDHLLADIQEFDQFLAAHDNRPGIAEFILAIATLAQRVGTSDWWQVRKALGTQLVSTVTSKVSAPLPQYAQSIVTRHLLVMGLVELYVDDPMLLQTPEEIRDALRWRIPVLPPLSVLQAELQEAGLTMPMPYQMLTRRPGFTDLYVIREEWNRYKAGEISYIENILPGEELLRRFVRTRETETQTVESTSKTTSEERDTQVTERSELQESAASESTLATHIDGKVDVWGTFGPTSIATHVGGSLDSTVHDTTARAAAQAREIVSRAATKVEETVTKLRSQRTLERVKETTSHGIKNPTGEPVVGIYRWVDKVQRVQTTCYPNRFVMELEVPEPGAWLRWLHAKDDPVGILSENPLPFTIDGTETGTELTAKDVTESSYLKLGARYRTAGLEPPPTRQILSVIITIGSAQSEPSNDKQFLKYITSDKLAVPDGWEATSWRAAAMSWTNYDQTSRDPKPAGWTNEDNGREGALNDGGMWISVGASDPVQKYAYGDAGPIRSTLVADAAHQVGAISRGIVPVSIMTNALNGIVVNVELECTPTQRAFDCWRIQCWERIVAAYYEMRSQYANELSAKQVAQARQEGSVSPERNAQIAVEELKKQVIGMLLGTRFTGNPAIQWDPNGEDEPDPDLARAIATAGLVQFMEQAFEWENLTYVLYPYYWADRSRWRDLAKIESADPAHAQFLRAGSARVVVPARPGFEAQVQFFLWLGVIWSGGPVPAPDDECYLSVAVEIQDMQRRPSDGFSVDAWEVRLPTTLVWLENDRPLPSNPAPTIQLPCPPEPI